MIIKSHDVASVRLPVSLALSISYLLPNLTIVAQYNTNMSAVKSKRNREDKYIYRKNTRLFN